MNMSKLLIPCLVIGAAVCIPVHDISPGCRDHCRSKQETPYASCIKTCPDCHNLKNRTHNEVQTYLDPLGKEKLCSRLCVSANVGGSEDECMKNCQRLWCVRYGYPSLFTTTTQPPSTTSQSPTQHGKKNTQTGGMASGVSAVIIVTCILVVVVILVVLCLRQKCHQQDGKPQKEDDEVTVACACTDVTTDAVEETGRGAQDRALLAQTTTV